MMDSTLFYALVSIALSILATVFAVSCWYADRKELQAEHDLIMRNLKHK